MEVKNYKEALKKDTAKYQMALEKEIDIFVNSSKNTARNALIIGGTLTVSYLLLRKLTKSKKVSKKKKPGVVPNKEQNESSQPSIIESVSEMILKELSLYLLSYAKDKILTYLDTIKDNDEQHS